jgi:hypothetical protein
MSFAVERATLPVAGERLSGGDELEVCSLGAVRPSASSGPLCRRMRGPRSSIVDVGTGRATGAGPAGCTGAHSARWPGPQAAVVSRRGSLRRCEGA